MALPLVLMAAGTALQIAGQYRANLAQAKAELQNAEYYEDQAAFVQAATTRQSLIAERQYGQLQGAQLGAYAKGGVDISGSAASVIAETAARKIEEITAIRYKGQLDYKLAKLRAGQARETSETLSDPGYNLMQAGGTLLTNFGKQAEG